MNKRTTGEIIFDTINVIFMIFFILIMILPFIFVINGSIVSENEFIRTGGVILIPKSLSFNTYRFLFREGTIVHSFFTSVKRLLIGVPFSMFLTILLAYAMTKKEMPGQKALMAFVIFMMYFDGGLVPRLVLYKDIKLYDNFWVYVLPAGISVYNALLLRNFFDTIPESLSESAVIDGASESCILFKIILPLSKPGIATIALFVAVTHWNDWFTGIAFMRQTSALPLQTFLRKMITISQLELEAMGSMQDMKSPIPEPLKMGAIVLTTIPIVLVYPFVQKYFVQGLLIGSVKE
jgi:putative aldouronate transport system permease protein